MEEDNSDLSDEGHGCSSNGASHWASLPDVCLRHVFRLLSDRDRRSADLVCHRWHHAMRSPSLWRSRFFYFSGRISRFKQSEYCHAVAYARSVGVYLERLEVYVCPPYRTFVARRLASAISGLFSELTRVNTRLRSLSLVRLELDRTCWKSQPRRSVVSCLINFFRRRHSALSSVRLNNMRNYMNHGLDLLSALSYSQRHRHNRCYISSLELRGFFSGAMHVNLNLDVPYFLHLLQGLTHLSLSYSCLSDQLLAALQRHRRGSRHSSRDGNTLQTFSLHCHLNEPHRQMVSGSSWAALASHFPDLTVRLMVDQVIYTNWLARILLPEIPLTEYTMTAFYSPNELWSIRPLLTDMLPQYRCRLQYLTLDLSNWHESLDDELLELVRVCERLEQLRVWAVLEISTVGGLLQIRLTQRNFLNKIKVRIYSLHDDTGEQEEQLEEILSSYLHLPPELEFCAVIYPYVDN